MYRGTTPTITINCDIDVSEFVTMWVTFRTQQLATNLSQEQLACKLQIIGLDVTQKVISRIENGSRVVADYELDYLATALGTTINHLLGKE